MTTMANETLTTLDDAFLSSDYVTREYVDGLAGILSGFQTETWTFTLSDDSTVVKTVLAK